MVWPRNVNNWKYAWNVKMLQFYGKCFNVNLANNLLHIFVLAPFLWIIFLWFCKLYLSDSPKYRLEICDKVVADFYPRLAWRPKDWNQSLLRRAPFLWANVSRIANRAHLSPALFGLARIFLSSLRLSPTSLNWVAKVWVARFFL